MNLQPARLWAHFEALARIPRCSGNETQAGDYVVKIAERMGLPALRDACGNVVVRKPASPGASGPPVVLQAHLDMVCEKRQGHGHDFTTDPIIPVLDGEWVQAAGTSLGADNGIGLAAALAILEDGSLRHPALELVATVEEEVGLKGASLITAEGVAGRRLINLDAEDEDVLLVGCAGGIEVSTTRALPCLPVVMADGESIRIVVEGLRGGHSGIDIHKGRANALSVLAISIEGLLAARSDLFIGGLAGGTKSNAIPRDAHAEVLVANKTGLQEWAADQTAWWRHALGDGDPGVTVRIEAADRSPIVLTPDSTSRLLLFLSAFPHGVWAVDPQLGGVATSANLAVVTIERGTARVLTSLRSSSPETLDLAVARVEALMRLMGWTPSRENAYPAWPRAASSPLLARATEAFLSVYGAPPSIETVHAGLECGILSQRLPGLDAISIGPTIRNPHSPDERVNIGSVGRFWGFLVALLARLAE